MYNLKIIIGSTRPGRKGPIIAKWFYNLALKHGDFQVELVDLVELNLPIFNEPEHPRFKKYVYEHTINWSTKIEAADAVVLVTPEYNFAFPASVKNALDYLSQEWGYKPIGFVSYGGVAAGTRAVQMLKQVVTALKMMPVAESVNIPFFTRNIDDNGNFNADEGLNKAADTMLYELLVWAKSLKQIRESKK